MKKMNGKKLVFGAIVALVIGAAALRLHNRNQDWQTAESGVGEPLLPEFDPGMVQTVEIIGATEQTTLSKDDDGGWQVVERYGYPVNFASLSSLVSSLQDMKIKRLIQSTPENQAALELDGVPPKNDDSLAIRFLNQDSDVIKTIVLGTMHEKNAAAAADSPMPMPGYPGGRYVRVVEDNLLALVEDTFTSVEPKPTDWLARDFVSINDVISVERFNQNNELAWRVSRDDKNSPLELENPPKNEEVNDSALRSIGYAFNWMKFADVAEPELEPTATGLDNPEKIKVLDAHGSIFEFSLGDQRDDGLIYAQIKITPAPDNEKEKEKSEKTDADDAEKTGQIKTQNDEEYCKKIATMSKKTDDWVYLLNASDLNNVRVAKDKLMQQEKDAD